MDKKIKYLKKYSPTLWATKQELDTAISDHIIKFHNGSQVLFTDTTLKSSNYFYVSSKGMVCSGQGAKKVKTLARAKFGNYFKTKKKAELARKRMASLFNRINKRKVAKKIVKKITKKEMTFYCIRCRSRKYTTEYEKLQMKNGKFAFKAYCPTCKTTMFKIATT